MNKERLEIVAQWLEAGAPERNFNMMMAIEADENADNWCGSTCCIAGYVATHFNPDFDVMDDVFKEAQNFLGLETPVSDALFFPNTLGAAESGDYLGVYWMEITPFFAAQAVRNVMEHNDPKWEVVMKEHLRP